MYASIRSDYSNKPHVFIFSLAQGKMSPEIAQAENFYRELSPIRQMNFAEEMKDVMEHIGRVTDDEDVAVSHAAVRCRRGPSSRLRRSGVSGRIGGSVPQWTHEFAFGRATKPSSGR